MWKTQKNKRCCSFPFSCFAPWSHYCCVFWKPRWYMHSICCALLCDLNAHAMDQPPANSKDLCLWPLQWAQNKVQVSEVQLIYNDELAVMNCWCHSISHHSFRESSSLHTNKTNGPVAACNLSHVRCSLQSYAAAPWLCELLIFIARLCVCILCSQACMA